MNLILITTRPSGALVRRTVSGLHHFFLIGCGLGVLLAGAAGGGYWLGQKLPAGEGRGTSWQARLAQQQQEIAQVRREARAEVNALTSRLAELQSRMTRLDALGKRLIERAGLDSSEFDFSRPPGVGGLAPSHQGQGVSTGAIAQQADTLAEQMKDRQNQLSVIRRVLAERQLERAAEPAGDPVASGWMSSAYGYRKDPFTGKKTWHDGVDFAGREGSPIEAVGAGVVSYAGKRWGYGRLVEITHGDGYVTRYGHNQKIVVEAGEIVRRGDKIAEMGSTGRSTGPHVHLEVLKDGESVNPWEFVQAER
jgi:murein DD-endopeptidase MepM/ murein hydrolase activator NlpD